MTAASFIFGYLFTLTCIVAAADTGARVYYEVTTDDS